MEPSVEIYEPSRLYARVGWTALAGSAVCLLCGFRVPLVLIPGGIFLFAFFGFLWLASRPAIRVGETQFNIGDRAIAWQEVREINSSRFVSPLVLKLKLTNSRYYSLIFPGEPEQIARLMFQLRKNSQEASFDGVAHRDYWTWTNVAKLRGDGGVMDQPTPMLSREDEDEVERMYQKLKAVGRLDSRTTDSKTSHEE